MADEVLANAVKMIATATFPATCDCGVVTKVKIVGLTEDSEFRCPKCGTADRFDFEDIERLQEEFAEKICELCDQLEVDQPNDDVMDFILAHGRLPTPSEARKPSGYPVGLSGESNYQAAIGACSVGEPVTLMREPGNPYDPRAIAVICKRGRTLGYIPRDSFVQRLVHEEGNGCEASILKLTGIAERNFGVVLDLKIGGGPIGERAFFS